MKYLHYFTREIAPIVILFMVLAIWQHLAYPAEPWYMTVPNWVSGKYNLLVSWATNW